MNRDELIEKYMQQLKVLIIDQYKRDLIRNFLTMAYTEGEKNGWKEAGETVAESLNKIMEGKDDIL